MWYQRSIAKWLMDGDRNTEYYHMKTIIQRRYNKIIMLKNEQSDYIDKEEELKKMVNDYYHHMFEIRTT